MPELSNSQRRLNKVTYVPLKIHQETAPVQDGGQAPGHGGANPIAQNGNIAPPTMRVLDKLSLLRSLRILKPEFEALAQTVWGGRRIALGASQALLGAGNRDIALLDVIQTLVSDPSPATTARYAPLLGEVSSDDLLALGDALIQQRQAFADALRTKVDELHKEFVAAQRKALATPQRSAHVPAKGAATVAAIEPPGAPPALATVVMQTAQTLMERAAVSVAAVPQTPTLGDQLRWGQANSIASAGHLAELAKSRLPLATTVGLTPELIAAFLDELPHVVICNKQILLGFQERFKVEPIGRLHLERLEMTPVGIEHGELVHSVPLTPNETVNISHREWSIRAEEFDQIVQDVLEGYSEQGVAEKSDITRATESQSKHDSQLDINGSVNAHYDGGNYQITASAAVDYKTQSTDQQAAKDSTRHALEVSRKAASRTKRDHKMSFKVSSVAATEDLAVRVLTNPSPTQAMRVDYFQLMRKWRVKLMRYGLRLTYDIVIPNPGADLTGKVLELQNVTNQLLTDKAFPLDQEKVTRDTWRTQAAIYGAAVDPPPDELRYEALHRELRAYDRNPGFEAFDLDVDDKYQVNTALVSFEADANAYLQDIVTGQRVQAGGGALYFQENDGKSGRLSYPYLVSGLNGHNGGIELSLTYALKSDARSNWQLKAWTAMQQAWDEKQLRDRQLLRDRQAQLVEEINKFDALTLRMMEREEIMKGVLRWIFGPDFDFDPFGIKSYYDADKASPDQQVLTLVCGQDGWERVMNFGEFIKYIHSAIEWENVLYLPYPYFWDHPANHSFKRFLWHPDAIHRGFLRSGAARVVLTIREGFEESFTQLVETGAFDQLPEKHAYVSIGTEIHNFAKTNYPGIPPANPDKNVRPLLYPEQQKAWDEIQQLTKLLDAYFAKNKHYPTTEDWGKPGRHPLADFVLPLDPGTVVDNGNLVNDPWGNPYVYVCPGIHGAYDLASFGSDGKPNTIDVELEDPQMAADITNWAEGSLIATWFEYTPTSALDVAVTMSDPNTVKLSPPQLT